MKYIITFFFIIQTAHAVVKTTILCDLANRMLGGTLRLSNGSLNPGYGVKIDVALYKNSNRILCLSDKPHDISIGEVLSQRYPEKEIISSDYGYLGTEITGNYKKMYMDNTASFPFEDNYFDSVVLRRGLCICQGDFACAGFCATDYDSALHFFGEIARVLNKNNPHAVAVLHGSYRVTEGVLSFWRKVFKQIEANFPVVFEINKNNENFAFIKIKPRPIQ